MKKKLPLVLFVNIIIILLFPDAEVLSNYKNGLSGIIAKFEEEHSTSAVIILEASKGFVEFAYNNEYVFERSFPPGSIAKVWTTIVLLENREMFLFDNSPVNCGGKFFVQKSMLNRGDLKTYNLPYDWKIEKNYFRCSLRRGHGVIDLRKGLSHSCNVYFLSKVSKKPGPIFRLTTEKFYLNRNTGARIKGIFEAIPPTYNNISSFQSIASSIGEGGYIRVSPAKIAQIFASILLGTPFLRPHKNQKTKSYFYKDLNISNESRNLVKASLSRVLLQGTLAKINIKNQGVQLISGKTGTGTHYRKKYATHGWNVIYYKYNSKKYILVTFVYKGSGSKEAMKLSELVLNGL